MFLKKNDNKFDNLFKTVTITQRFLEYIFVLETKQKNGRYGKVHKNRCFISKLDV